MIANSSDIFSCFERYGLNRTSMVHKQQLRTILNELLLAHGPGKTSIITMPTQIETELWQKTIGSNNGQVVLADYVLTIEKAQDILLLKIQQTQVSRRQIQAEVDMVRRLIELAKGQKDYQEAQRLAEKLVYLGEDSMKYDEELEGYKEDLRLVTIPFKKGGHMILKEVTTTVQTTEVVTVEKDIIQQNPLNNSFQNPLNISHRSANALNVSQRSANNRNILDTSAQKQRDLSMRSSGRPPLPPSPLPPLLQQSSTPDMIEQKIVTTTVAQSPLYPQNDILHHGLSPRPLEPLGPQYQNSRLYYIFWMSFGLLFVELFQMLEKPLMLGVLASLAVIGMFVLRMFGSTNIKGTIALIILSVLLDVVWVVVMIKTFLTKNCGVDCLFSVWEAHHKWPYETVHPGLHITILVMMFIGLFLKVVISVLLFSFRYDTYFENERYIRLFGHELILNSQALHSSSKNIAYIDSPQQIF